MIVKILFITNFLKKNYNQAKTLFFVVKKTAFIVIFATKLI